MTHVKQLAPHSRVKFPEISNHIAFGRVKHVTVRNCSLLVRHPKLQKNLKQHPKFSTWQSRFHHQWLPRQKNDSNLKSLSLRLLNPFWPFKNHFLPFSRTASPMASRSVSSRLLPSKKQKDFGRKSPIQSQRETYTSSSSPPHLLHQTHHLF